MTFRLPKLYAISDVQLSRLSHVEQVRAFCSGGATLIQLRDKVSPTDEFYRQAKNALEVVRDFGARLLINDRVDVALAVSADGVHLGQEDLPPDAARRVLGPDAIIGFSTHNVGQALEASGFPVDYLAIGPVFATRTKQNPDLQVGLKTLREVRRSVGTMPLVAIGGITLETASELLAAGADSVAVISWLLAPGEGIESRTRRFISAVYPHRT